MTHSNPPLLEVTDLTKTYGTKTVLSHVNLRLYLLGQKTFRSGIDVN